MVNPAQQVVVGGAGKQVLHLGGGGGQHSGGLGLAQVRGVFFAHDGVAGKGLGQGLTDNGLGTVVGNGDRALIIFFDRLGH